MALKLLDILQHELGGRVDESVGRAGRGWDPGARIEKQRPEWEVGMVVTQGDTLRARQGRDVFSASDNGTDLDLVSALCLLSREDSLVRDDILIAETVDAGGYGRRKASRREAGEMLRVKACAPCSLGYEALDVGSQERLLEEIPSWSAGRGGQHTLSRTFTFDHPVDALGFVNSVAILADEERHFPVLHLENRNVAIRLTTPEVRGLSESDFILAAKIDRLYSMFMEPMLLGSGGQQ